MSEYAALRMEHRILFYAPHPVYLAEPGPELVHLFQHRKEYGGGDPVQQCLSEFRLNSLSREHGGVDAAAELHCLRGYGESQPRGELRRSVDSQWILRERAVVHMPQDPAFYVSETSEVVGYLAGQHVLHEGIDGEITPPGGVLSTDERIYIYVETAVSAFRGGSLLPGQSYV